MSVNPNSITPSDISDQESNDSNTGRPQRHAKLSIHPGTNQKRKNTYPERGALSGRSILPEWTFGQSPKCDCLPTQLSLLMTTRTLQIDRSQRRCDLPPGRRRLQNTACSTGWHCCLIVPHAEHTSLLSPGWAMLHSDRHHRHRICHRICHQQEPSNKRESQRRPAICNACPIDLARTARPTQSLYSKLNQQAAGSGGNDCSYVLLGAPRAFCGVQRGVP
jgi:hypothetical protein